MNGNPFRLSTTQGDVVVVNFFSTTCPACQAEAQDLNDLYLANRTKGLRVIGIALRPQSVAQVEAFRDTYDIPFTILLDDNVVSQAYAVSGTPDAYFIDREGYTVERVQGFKSRSLLDAITQPLLDTAQ